MTRSMRVLAAAALAALLFGLTAGLPAQQEKQAPPAEKTASPPKAAEPTDPADAKAEEKEEQEEPDDIESAREMLRLLGVDDSYLDLMLDGEDIEAADREALLKLLYAVRRFKPLHIFRFRQTQGTWQDAVAEPAAHRGTIWLLRGRVRSAAPLKLNMDEAQRYDNIKEFYRCDLLLGSEEKPATVYVLDVPNAWKNAVAPPGQWRSSLLGFFVKLGKESKPVFVAQHIAWHPPGLLGDLGMDMGLFDEVRNARPFSAQESEAFYNLLAAVARERENALKQRTKVFRGETEFQIQHIRDWVVFPWKLEQAADEITPTPAGQTWRLLPEEIQAEIQELPYGTVPDDGFRQRFLDALNSILKRKEYYDKDAWKDILFGQRGLSVLNIPEQQLLKRGPNQLSEAELMRLNRLLMEEAFPNLIARTRGYSVIPLFNHPQQQTGRLMRFRGLCRRAIRIDVTDPHIAERLGVKHYYELEVFTDDSQSNPIVFCVREVPKKMPLGKETHHEVEIPAIFYKTWAYQVRLSPKLAKERGEEEVQNRVAPLLIGHKAEWIQPDLPEANPLYGWIAGGLFILAIGCVWFGVWRYNQGDEEFHRSTIAKQYEAEESLDEAGIEADGEPDFTNYQPPGPAAAEEDASPGEDKSEAASNEEDAEKTD